jgi:mannonate dehydratase
MVATSATQAGSGPQGSPLDRIPPGIKLAAQMRPEPTEDDLRWVAQMGIEYAVLWTDASKSSAEYYASRKALFADYGITVYGFGNADVHNQDAIVLGLENRDAKMEEYKRHLQSLGKAGIPYTTYAHMANGIWSSGRAETRGGASARSLDMDSPDARGSWATQGGRTFYTLPLTHGREYTEEALWDNFTTFIRRVAPVAEAEGVMIGIHPDDPPGLTRIGGVPRLFSTMAGYQKALSIADSPNVGVCLCLGCWLEGGDLMGATAEEAIRTFAAQKKLFKIHFRNVDRPLPHFVETFLDDGYQDMSRLMLALQEAGFNGIVIPDHIPTMTPDPRLGTAFTLGYMKALRERAVAEAGPRPA